MDDSSPWQPNLFLAEWYTLVQDSQPDHKLSVGHVTSPVALVYLLPLLGIQIIQSAQYLAWELHFRLLPQPKSPTLATGICSKPVLCSGVLVFHAKTTRSFQPSSITRDVPGFLALYGKASYKGIERRSASVSSTVCFTIVRITDLLLLLPSLCSHLYFCMSSR